MKDGSTHMAHKAEHAVDMETGAVIAVTLQAADQGDTTTMQETLAEAGEAVAELIEREAEKAPEAKPQVNVGGIAELVADKGYHSGPTVVVLGQAAVRTYIPEPKRGRRKWEGKEEEQQAVYGNRRRVQGHHGKQLLKQARGVDRAHLCPLLRNRRHAANASARAREHSEAAVDSRLRVQSEPDLPADTGCGNASGATQPAGGPIFGVISCSLRSGAGRSHRKDTSTSSSSAGILSRSSCMRLTYAFSNGISFRVMVGSTNHYIGGDIGSSLSLPYCPNHWGCCLESTSSPFSRCCI